MNCSLRLGGFSRTPSHPLPSVSSHPVQARSFCVPGSLYTSSFQRFDFLHRNVGYSCDYYAFHVKRTKNIPVDICVCHASDSERELFSHTGTWHAILASLNAFYKFSRPHTVIGTTLSIISVSLLAIEKLSDFSTLFLTGLLQALAPALLMNIYIVGLNQIFDVEIDKINKPTLPLASGEYSITTGIMIVTISVIVSFSISYMVGSWPLFWALFISFVLGTAYSINLPFFRWKRFAFVAAMCILAIRAVVVQLAFYAHMKSFVFGTPAALTRPLTFATAFMSFFSIVIALFKDIPDIDGDRIFGIKSFSVRLGQKRVFWICIFLLEIAYGVAAAVGLTSSSLWSKLITVLGHLFLSLYLWDRAQSLDVKNQSAIKSFYMFIWKVDQEVQNSPEQNAESIEKYLVIFGTETYCVLANVSTHDATGALVGVTSIPTFLLQKF